MIRKRRQWKMDNRAFQNHITYEYIDSLNNRLDELHMSRRQFAKKLGVTEGRVSQMFNNPSNFTLGKMVEWARELELKVSVLAFEDKDDPKGPPIFSHIFKTLWEISGRPRFDDELETIKQKHSGEKDIIETNLIFITKYIHPPTWELEVPDQGMFCPAFSKQPMNSNLGIDYFWR